MQIGLLTNLSLQVNEIDVVSLGPSDHSIQDQAFFLHERSYKLWWVKSRILVLNVYFLFLNCFNLIYFSLKNWGESWLGRFLMYYLGSPQLIRVDYSYRYSEIYFVWWYDRLLVWCCWTKFSPMDFLCCFGIDLTIWSNRLFSFWEMMLSLSEAQLNDPKLPYDDDLDGSRLQESLEEALFYSQLPSGLVYELFRNKGIVMYLRKQSGKGSNRNGA